MKYRKLGKWGLKVSEISVGSWMTQLTDKIQIDTAKQSIKTAFDEGINFFDCADAYSGGDAERFLGDLLSEYRRSDYVVSSKVFFPTGKGVNDRGLSRKHIFENVDKSLKNLKTDYLDMYFCHRYDSDTPVEETMEAMSDLVKQGKILYYGVSEWLPSQVMDALRVIEKYNMRPLNVIQPQYNMVDRFIEDEMMSICEKTGIGIVAFSPLAQGLLTGKYKKGAPLPEGSRATHQADKQINKLLTEENLDKVEKMSKIAEDLGITMSQLALAWTLRKPCMSSLITGASKPEQVIQNAKASDVVLSADVLNDIEKILDYKPFFRKIG